jgi:cytochrome b561
MPTPRPTAGPRPGFDLLTILLHWLTVLAIAWLGASGVWLALSGAIAPTALLLLHRSAGAAVWLITLVRLSWRASFARLPPFPENISRFRTLWIYASERSLYTLLLAQPLTGMLMSLSLGRPFQLFTVTLPALLLRNLDLWQIFFVIHRDGALVLFGVVGAHASVGLVQHYIFGNNVLRAMLPGRQPARFTAGAPESTSFTFAASCLRPNGLGRK